MPKSPTVLGRKSLGSTIGLDLARMNAEGILTPESPDGHLSEELRRIKRPLLDNAFGRTVWPTIALAKEDPATPFAPSGTYLASVTDFGDALTGLAAPAVAVTKLDA